MNSDSKIMTEAKQKLSAIKKTHENNPLIVKVSPDDIQRIVKGFIFQVVAWDNMDKQNPTITLQLIS